MIPAGIWLGHCLKMLCPLWAMVCLWQDALNSITALGSVGNFVWSTCVEPLKVSLASCPAMDVGVEVTSLQIWKVFHIAMDPTQSSLTSQWG